MNFFRYRQNFSNAKGEWQYIDHPWADGEGFAYELNQEYDWSDHYRGCDVERIDAPPIEWLEKRKTGLENSIKYTIKQIEDYSELIKKLKESVDT